MLKGEVKTTLGNDGRFITGLYGPNEEWQIVVGPNKVDIIMAYSENDGAPWFAVYHAGEITQRVNAAFVECVAY